MLARTAAVALVAVAASAAAASAAPYTNSSYYGSIDWSLTDGAMIKQLHMLISDHTSISYKQVWSALEELDVGVDQCSDEQVEDVYGGYCYSTGQQCGNYKQAGDCFNREHSWPKSWWGGFSRGDGAQTDLFHLRPADGWINAKRSNYPFGPVDEPTWTGPTGARFGPCGASANAPENTLCFAPPDSWKGDLARGYFYLSVAYRNEWTCCTEAGVSEYNLNAWEEAVLRDWHNSDPVSSFESGRNDAIFANWQHNRNPFIDHPEIVAQISDF